MMRRTLSVALAALLFVAAMPLVSAETPEKAGEAAALSWLGLVDAGKYGESWDATAEAFRGSVTKEKWQSMLGQARQPLGKMVSRNLTSAKHTTQISGAPAGDYVVLQFDTSFEHRPSSIETVSLVKEKDGSWKVGGYFIK